ncbi:MAG: DPP IV N-terminal domain-containing protein [Planctomycetes bacterium]|nr:DPP IV N-terminal domain-containing protein [Planctomycetota bacterium]
MSGTRRHLSLLAAVLALVALVAALPAVAQDEEHGVAVGRGDRELTLDLVLARGPQLYPRAPEGLAWHPDGARITWIRPGPGGPELVAASVSDGVEAVLLDTPALRKAWEAARLEGAAPPLSRAFTWHPDGKSLRLFDGGALYRVTLEPLRVACVHRLPKGAGPIAMSPGDVRIAFVQDHDVHLLEADGTVTTVTRGGHEDLTHGVSVSREEFGIHDGMWWDPTGRRLAFYQENLLPVAPYPYVDFTPRPAVRVHGRYPMAGRKGSVVRVGVFDTRTGKAVWLDTDPGADEYLTNVTWGPGGERLYVAHVCRGQDQMALAEYDAATGRRLRTLLTENDDQWVEPEHGPVFLPDDSGRFLWLSPREGYDQFYLVNSEGKVARKLTTGEHDVLAFTGWDPEGTGFFYESPGEDPRHKHLFHASLEGGERRITTGRGQHETAVAADGRHVLDVHSSLELPLAVDVLTVRGEAVRRLHAATNPLAPFRLGTHRFFTVKTAEGEELYGHLILPPDPDPTRKHPVLHYVYGGPHVQLVQDRWLGGGGRWMLWLHLMAARGYIVVRLDNRGTLGRGIEFEQAIHRRLGTLETEDQLRALDHVLGLGRADPDRVGVHGWSYGGFMTLALMTRAGARYRAGVAGAPVTDWAYYETGYGERYMDTPEDNPEGYKAACPGERVRDIRGRLLVVHGLADQTVMWQNTVDFVARAIEADVEVETMIYPGQDHGLRGKAQEHCMRKMTAFFDRELEPHR